MTADVPALSTTTDRLRVGSGDYRRGYESGYADGFAAGSASGDVEAVLAEALTRLLPEYLSEWRSTCKEVGIPYTDKDAAAFVVEGIAGQLAALALSTSPAEGTTVTEWGVRWGKVDGRAREVGQVEHYGTRPGGDIGPFSEADARYIAGSTQTVVTRQRTRYPDRVTEWTEVTP